MLMFLMLSGIAAVFFCLLLIGAKDPADQAAEDEEQLRWIREYRGKKGS